MATAHAHFPPPVPPVPPVPPLAPPRLAPHASPSITTMHVRLQGELLRPARKWHSMADGAMHLECILAQPTGLPVRLVQHFGASAAAHCAADSKAALLRKGTQVQAHGTGLKLGWHQGEPCLELINTEHLAPTVLGPCGRAAAAGNDDAHPLTHAMEAPWTLPTHPA